MASNTIPSFPITVEFTGGLELLFSNQRKHNIQVPEQDSSGAKTNISWLVDHLCNNVMKDSRKDMFVLHNSVRPGILVLINDADWELEGESNYELQKGDSILFVSTLHGG
ncbi:ubiquitin related modifier 1 [Microthyrium microscopicum]|uniref:Ubiquitin-related modifier 1 n=1 Tax=Microthyrium microscopicum TaxID=703497 RepID=A0A6A6UEE4_9PEZI|nr:ubiquitin related modifier 1 [Microthyrium microscopicum]